MSIFSKYVKERLVVSNLVQTDGSIIELKFKPMGLADQESFKGFATLDTESVEEITKAAKTCCGFLAKQITSAKTIKDGVETDEVPPTEQDFIDLFEADYLTIIGIIEDFTPKKVSVESKK